MKDVEFVKISKVFLNDLCKIALILFPMEATAIIIGKIENKVFKTEKIILSPDLAFLDMVNDIRFYRKSKNLNEIKSKLEKSKEGKNNQDYISKRIDILMERKIRSKNIFKKFKEYLLINYKNSIEYKSTYQNTIIFPNHDGYDWVSEKQAFLCWHSHPLPNYKSLEKYTFPSHGDIVQVLKLLQRKQSVVGEIVTTIFEKDKILHKAFKVPEFVLWESYILKYINNDRLRGREVIPIITSK